MSLLLHTCTGLRKSWHFFDLSLSKEKGLSYHSGQKMLKINENLIFSEFLKIVKNTLTVFSRAFLLADV